MKVYKALEFNSDIVESSGVSVGFWRFTFLFFRKNVNERAHLYSMTFLSQMKFTKKDSELCCRLMSIYLSLFKTIVGKKITDNRLLPIVLAGANRAFPFAKDTEKLLEDVKDVYFLAHNSNYRTAIPALKLLFQFHKMNDYVSDRFYNALYRKLLDSCPAGAYAQLLKLMFDTMKEDASAQRVRSFVKRLLQIAVNAQPDFAASILLLISRLKKIRGDSEQLVVLSKDIDVSFEKKLSLIGLILLKLDKNLIMFPAGRSCRCPTSRRR